jgi:hypothetical protein
LFRRVARTHSAASHPRPTLKLRRPTSNPFWRAVQTQALVSPPPPNPDIIQASSPHPTSKLSPHIRTLLE